MMLMAGERQLAVLSAEKYGVRAPPHGLVVCEHAIGKRNDLMLPVFHLQLESSNGQTSQGARGSGFCPNPPSFSSGCSGTKVYHESRLNPSSSHFLHSGLGQVL